MGWFGRSDEDYTSEIHEHIDLETAANIERGMAPEEARRAARAAFGSVAGVRQRLHEGRSYFWLSALSQDVRYSLRVIGRNRLLSSVVVLTMSLGIGGTTAVFSLVNAQAFAAPGVHDPDSFVLFVSDDSGYQVATTGRYEALRAQARSVHELAVWSVEFLVATIGSTDGTRVQGVLVSCNFLGVVSDAPPLAGRLLQASDCAEAAPVAVLSRDLWRTRFASDPGVVGTSISYGGHLLTIVGVAAPTAAPDGLAAGVWIPYTVRSQVKDLLVFGGDEESSGFPSLGMIGRLAPGSSRRAAAAEFRVLTAREDDGPDPFPSLKLTDGSLWSMAPIETLWMFASALAFPALVALIVCATVATLLLSRAVKRQREMAIRLAVGGSRSGLVRMLLVENLLLASLAAVVGLTLVYGLPPVILGLWFTGSSLSGIIHPDWRVLAYMGVVTLLTALAAGAAPALESLNLQLGESLKGRLVLTGRGGITWTRALLVGTQVAFSMVLLVGAAGIIRADRFMADPGFETRQVVSAQLPQKPTVAHDPSSLAALVAGLPAVRSTAYADSLPSVFEGATILEALGQPFLNVHSARVSPDYFKTLGIRILDGRAFEEADATRGGDRPVVVSQRFAARYFPGRSPVGQILTESGSAGKPRRLAIVGVAANRAIGTGPFLGQSDGSFVYLLKESSLSGYLMVRLDGDATQAIPALQNVLKQATGWALTVTTLRARIDQRLTTLHGFETLMTAIGVVGLTLTLMGVFGLLAFTAAQRRKEVAIRTALGARRADVFRTMMLPAMWPTGIGVAVGACLSFAALRVTESISRIPVGMPSVDPVPYLAGGLLLLSAAFAAMSAPAYRATLSDPARALRED